MKRFAAVVALVALAACSSSAHSKATDDSTSPTTVKPACSPSRIAPPAQSSYTFDGRTYRLALPSGYDGSRAWPMLMVFHGFASSKEAIDADTALDQLGPPQGFIVVTPDGSSNPRTWNFIAGASGSQADDYTFVDALLVHLERQLCVDTKRIYATGHSAGSAFVGFLICHKPYRFAGAAMVSATIPSSCPGNVVPKIISVHGTADPVVLYNGGKGQGQTVAIPPVKQTVAELAQRASCNSTPRQDHPANGVDRATYTGCAKGSAVEQITIVDGGHPWAGGLQAKAEERTVPGAQFSASKEILRFLASGN